MAERSTQVKGGDGRLLRLIARSRLDDPMIVACAFAWMILVQALSLLLLGTGSWGRGMSALGLIFHNILAIACSLIAFSRARRAGALFWFLYSVSLATLLVPTALGAYELLFQRSVVSASTWRLLFCLYGAPILMMLFLPEHRERVRGEALLDMFQVALVVGLTFFTFFLLPVRQMLPLEALARDISLSNLQSLFLLMAVFTRFSVARLPDTRNLWLRVGLFLIACAVVTFIGNWIDLHHFTTASAWFDLGWALPYVIGGLVAVTWTPSAQKARQHKTSESTTFWGFLGSNLVLVAMLCVVQMIMVRWGASYGEAVAAATIIASLLAFAVRLALTQFQQQQEIAQRKSAQDDLLVANHMITGLLRDAEWEVTAIAQINELGSALQASKSRGDAIQALPDRLAMLFPGTVGELTLENPLTTECDRVVRWGPQTAVGNCIPSDISGVEPADLVSIPLMVNGSQLGLLKIIDAVEPQSFPLTRTDRSLRFRQLASTAAEQIALNISNLDLRETLSIQATRDALTGLHNRRYMKEFVERELHRAQRRNLPFAVIMLDIDHFKKYNDTFGHPAGDEALCFVAEMLLSSVRAEDLAVRYGGEEFVLLLPECSLEQAVKRADQIRVRMKERSVRQKRLREMITISVGVSAFPETAESVQLLIKSADTALYKAKHSGRDRVVAAQTVSGQIEGFCEQLATP
jgi:diguanylate cyclase (GGDEF)-like protein